MKFTDKHLNYKHTVDERPTSELFYRHAHAQYEFLYFLEGDAECVIERRRHHLKAGELVLIPPLHYHFIRIITPVRYERAVIHFQSCDIRDEILQKVFSQPRVMDFSADQNISALFKRIDRYVEHCDKPEKSLLVNNLLTELVYLVSCHDDLDQPFAVYYNETINAAIQYIESNLTTVSSAEEIAAALFVSRSHLYQCFNEAFHMPPMKYITEKRLVLAASRIAMGERPTKVALACGFNDYSAFFRAYKRRFGHSPKELE